jgi:hypothetical protein
MLCLSLSMPRTPKGYKRPADVIGNAVHVMRIATGEVEEAGSSKADTKTPAAVELGRLGGQARAESLSRRRRVEIARLGGIAKAKKGTGRRRS